MADGKRDKKTETVQRLLTKTMFFDDELNKLFAANPSTIHALGSVALSAIYADLDEKGLRSFTRWAVDSERGFHVTSTADHPLPPELEEVFRKLVESMRKASKLKDGLSKANSGVDRRGFLSAVGGAGVGGGLGWVLGATLDNDDTEAAKWRRVAYALFGAGAGAAWAHRMSRPYREIAEIRATILDNLQKEPTPEETQERIDHMAFAAASTLETLLSPELGKNSKGP